MTRSVLDEVRIQRDYYRTAASRYDQVHASEKGEHDLALAFMLSMVTFLNIRSVLDIGSGTGRALLQLKSAFPNLIMTGVEPSPELRSIAYAKGLSPAELMEGDAQQLPFANGSFDLVCEFGALHHIPHPAKAVSEMLRVASKAIFISDCNNFGQGSPLSRTVKQALHALKLWPAVDFLKTRGKGYKFSEGDGLAYSYSVFADYQQISRGCSQVHVMNTRRSGVNLYRSASTVALLGIK
jgi:ubiquinone/menaquinone biosynthesis C-methylase UbiE